ncbi:hypothetical protein [Candidatus Palauibacter polyketidifaciens]|uniref:hypothetical protein n=1 Tax=Candidatus Palauibacter polyketidifaciens TaxID=3056740 RepID=UPI00239EB7CD|nr:hypothetical protein [Candidatus Palauibacter polyketidifaciens]MDE2720709.1 hypothetical protein [Candidatus Palauibacter polyketidifaciens]
MALAVALSGQACVWSVPLATTPSADPPPFADRPLYAVGWTQIGAAGVSTVCGPCSRS